MKGFQNFLSNADSTICEVDHDSAAYLPASLRRLYFSANGVYAYNRSLLVRPLESEGDIIGLHEWNRTDLWKYMYRDLIRTIDEHFFFAQNVYGEQFYFMDGVFGKFDPETGECENMGQSLDSWANKIASDSEFILGTNIANEWDRVKGVIDAGNCLMPKIPFVLGGDFSIDNLVCKPDLTSLKIRAALSGKLSRLNDGDKIVLYVED